MRPLVFVFLVALVLTACGGNGDSTGSVAYGDDVTIDMFDNRFQFTEIRIPVGGSVTWRGAGRNPHNAVASDESWSTETEFGSLEQLEGDDAKLVYNQAGEYVFFCTFHGNAEGAGMAGKLIVGGD